MITVPSGTGIGIERLAVIEKTFTVSLRFSDAA
jgi:hypothetical protein